MAGGEALQPAPGARVLLGGKHRATVRYVGTIDSQQGIWVGIEYDETGKGKHDGSHSGRRYFSCAYDPTAGSFVRLAKFLEAADFGRSLEAAAEERYGLGGAAAAAAGQLSGASPASDGQQQEELYVSTASNRRVAVELVLSKTGNEAERRLSAAGAAGLAAGLVQQSISSLVSCWCRCCDCFLAVCPAVLRLWRRDVLHLRASRIATAQSLCSCCLHVTPRSLSYRRRRT